MMALASPAGAASRESHLHARVGGDRTDAAYGTFDADDDDLYSHGRSCAASSSPLLPSPAMTATTRSRRATQYVSVVRAIAIAGVLVLAVSGMLILQEQSPPHDPHNHTHTHTHHAKRHDSQPHHKAPAVSTPPYTIDDSVSAAADSHLSTTEQQFIDRIDAAQIRSFLHAYAAVPHPAGSKQDYATAVYTAKQFEAYGLNATIKEYYPLLSTPIRRRLAIVAPADAARELNLTEGSVDGDACTSNKDALPPFLAYAATGNVTASVVYANFGRPEDFAWLVSQNVTLAGKIALVRYGGNYRGLKVMAAEQHGVAGVLIYSDPLDDGYDIGPVYPDGPWRPADSFQRGASIFLSVAPGDPLTPGYAATRDAPHLSVDDAPTIPHIPALPLSYGQAKFILQSLKGSKAPVSWQGGLAIDGGYFVGDDEATVLNLDLVMDNSVGPIWNVIGTIDGVDEPDQHVLIGNHRDAWVCGAVDPSSGSAALLEIARNLGALLKSGWQPRRTLVLGSWDGEEPGLLGSTEYVEDHAVALTRQAVAYINVDAVVGPFVATSGTPSIAGFLLETAKAIPANRFFGNETESSLFEQWTQQTAQKRAVLGKAASERGMLGPDHHIAILGSGSDFTPFYQHLGIVSANLGFSVGLSMYGTYHSAMDSLSFVERVGDPHFATQTTTTKWWGLLALRLADAAVLPFDYTTYGPIMMDALAELALRVAAMPRNVDFHRLETAIKRFSSDAQTFQRYVHAVTESSDGDDDKVSRRKALNRKLVSLERYLLTADGLPHRPWYKHVIFGPGFYEGYSGAAFPGIDDAIAFGDNATVIQEHVDEVTRVIESATAVLQLP